MGPGFADSSLMSDPSSFHKGLLSMGPGFADSSPTVPPESAKLPSQARYFLACLNQWLSTKNQASPLTRVLSTSLCRSVLNFASLCSLVSSCAAMFAASAFRWLDSTKESRAGRAKAKEGLE